MTSGGGSRWVVFWPIQARSGRASRASKDGACEVTAAVVTRLRHQRERAEGGVDPGGLDDVGDAEVLVRAVHRLAAGAEDDRRHLGAEAGGVAEPARHLLDRLGAADLADRVRHERHHLVVAAAR